MSQIGSSSKLGEDTQTLGSPPAPETPQPFLARSTSDKDKQSARDHAAMIKTAAGELDMESDHFYMYIYKVAPCLKNYTHDWSACPFAHKGEKATRRDPLKFSYMASNCPDFKRGMCPRGDNCSFAHGVFESCLHPERYRTQMCNSGTNCNRSVCFFAHTMSELRSPYCQNAPSQIDATTVASLRALLGRASSKPNCASEAASQQRPPPPPQQQQQQTDALLRNALASLPQWAQFQQQPGSWNPITGLGAQQSSLPAGDILNQACNLLCALHLLGGADQATARQSAVDAFKANPAAAQASLFNGISGLQQQGLISGNNNFGDWQAFGSSSDGGLSSLFNAASSGMPSEQSFPQQKQYNFLGRDFSEELPSMGALHMLQQQQQRQQQQAFSFLT